MGSRRRREPGTKKKLLLGSALAALTAFVAKKRRGHL